MTEYAIIETDIYGDIPEDINERCYLNHAYLNSMSFGSADMAWTTKSSLEAEGMASRMGDGYPYRHHKIIDLQYG